MRRSRAASDMSLELYHDDEALVRAELSEPNHEDYQLITDYLANELSATDRERVEARLRTDAAFRALAEPIIMVQKLSLPLGEPDPDDQVKAARAVRKFKERIEFHQQGLHTPTLDERRAKRRRWRSAFITTVGGLITGLLMMWLAPRLIPESASTMYIHLDATARAGRSARLPDATEAVLGPGTHLTYSRWLSSGDNTINLNGEVTFTVPAGRREALDIAGAGLEIKTTGGRFTVQAYDALPVAYVVVHEGQVQVKARTVYASSEFETVSAGERVRVGPALRIMHVGDVPIGPYR